MPKPQPKEHLRRLRAIYCRHRGISYREYDEMMSREEITFAELIELVEVLSTEIQNLGLHEYLFFEEYAEKRRLQERHKIIETNLKRLGPMARKSERLAKRYQPEIDRLVEEGNAVKRRLAEL